MQELAGEGVARPCRVARCGRANVLEEKRGGTVVLSGTGCPCHFSALLHGLVKTGFCGGFWWGFVFGFFVGVL